MIMIMMVMIMMTMVYEMFCRFYVVCCSRQLTHLPILSLACSQQPLSVLEMEIRLRSLFLQGVAESLRNNMCLVGGLVAIFYFPINSGNNHPN